MARRTAARFSASVLVEVIMRGDVEPIFLIVFFKSQTFLNIF
jgi:hypothetical protein